MAPSGRYVNLVIAAKACRSAAHPSVTNSASAAVLALLIGIVTTAVASVRSRKTRTHTFDPEDPLTASVANDGFAAKADHLTFCLRPALLAHNFEI